MALFQSPTGTKDWLPPDSERMAYLISSFSAHVKLANYHLVVSPMFEDSGVFVRGVGNESEVVTKEMYDFVDKGGRNLALRPEGTASIVRAFLQHNPPVPFKAWYVGPSFRYERPQAGRYRQHHQVGIEALGSQDPYLDFEVISLLVDWFSSLGLRDLVLKLNSLGDENCRPEYLTELSFYLEQHQDLLCPEHGKRWQSNPLRVLDCKKEPCVLVKQGAPKIKNSLCLECAAHLDTLVACLDEHEIDYVLDDYLVRGLDYYTRTTFEVACNSLDSSQNAIGGGGRYDNLARALGGGDIPGIGFASGLERVLLACESQGIMLPVSLPPKIFLIDITGGGVAAHLSHTFRSHGLACDRSFDNKSLKSQLRQADRSGAILAVIVGEKERAKNLVQLRWFSVDYEKRFVQFLTSEFSSVLNLTVKRDNSLDRIDPESTKNIITQYGLSSMFPEYLLGFVIKKFLFYTT